MKKPNFIQQFKHALILFFLLFLATACPSSSDKTLDEAQEALDDGQYTRALTLADSILQNAPDSFEASRIKALTHVAQAEGDKALNTYDLVETKHPEKSQTLLKEVAIAMVKLSLKDENFFVRSAGIKALGEMGDQHLIPLIIPGLRDSAMFVRFFAVESLGQLGGSEALKLIMAAGKDREGMVRTAAVKALNDMGTAKQEGLQLGNLLATFTGDADPAVRLFALAAMSKLGDEQAFLALLKGIKDLADDDKMVGVVALGRSKNPLSAKLLTRYLEEPDQMLRMVAAEAMGEFSSPLFYEPLKKALRDQDSAVRGAAATSLGKLGNRAIIPELEDLSKDAIPTVRVSAAEGLKRLGIGRPELYEAALKDPDYGVRHFAIGSLRKTWGKKAMPMLVSAAKDSTQRVRLTAIRAIGALGEMESLPLLKAALKDPDQAVRTYAAGNVARLINIAAGMQMKEMKNE